MFVLCVDRFLNEFLNESLTFCVSIDHMFASMRWSSPSVRLRDEYWMLENANPSRRGCQSTYS